MRRLLCGSLILLLLATQAGAEDRYYVVQVAELKFREGELPANWERGPFGFRYHQRAGAMLPYAVLDGAGEIYLDRANRVRNGNQVAARLAVRAPQGADVSGRLFVPKSDASGMVALKFTIPAEAGKAEDRNAFLDVKRAHYQDLFNRNLAGAAWFRHQVRDANQQLGRPLDDGQRNRRRFFGTNRGNELEDTFALVSGGRAVSENLQLDRVLPQAATGDANVPLASIQGITVREFNWDALTKDIDPQLDPLAALIPDDQHALLFPSFQSVLDMIDNADAQGTPVLRMADPRAEDAGTRERYQRQLCLPLGQLERLFGPQLIASVAVTGGDPYLRTGTDVGVLFQATNADALRNVLEARQALARKDFPAAQPVAGELLGVPYRGVRSEDRAVCSYLAALDNTIVVTNSPVQLERIVRVFKGGAPSLAALPEFKFFRHRYALGANGETALLVISDKTIRRWCGPRWRIATSRRTRAVAVMSELQAQQLDHLVAANLPDDTLKSTHWLPEVDHFEVTPSGLSSSVYGTLEFQTPISELDFQYATVQESNFYNRWRDGYQRNWSNFFDPIAVQFSVLQDKLAADLTVMPLIANTQYTSMIAVSKGAAIDADQGDPHAGALLHAALSLNVDSQLMKQASIMATQFAPQIRVNPLAWLGDTVALYVDQDAFWKDVAQVEPEKMDEFMRENYHRLPIAIHVDVKSGLKLVAFLAGLRAWIEETAPGMTVWETKQHGDRSYVKVGPSQQAKSLDDDVENLGVYYSASGKALIVSFSEDVLKRAIDRELARIAADKEEGGEPPAAALPWIGDNFCLQVDAKFVHGLAMIFGDNYQHVMQARAWGNLPILNEWRRRYPDHDPVELHERFWQRRLVCPAGGQYRWNAEWQTMESTVYGHPGQPQAGPPLPASLANVQLGNFGLTFEENGLRARVQLRRAEDADE